MHITKAAVCNRYRNEAIEILIATNDNLTKVQNMLVDSGYSDFNFAGAVKQILLCSVEVIKKIDLHTFKVKAMDSGTYFCLALEELRTQTFDFQASDRSSFAYAYFKKILDTFLNYKIQYFINKEWCSDIFIHALYCSSRLKNLFSSSC